MFLYSISIDPEHDTPAVLRRYARTIGAKPGWLFLTGEARDIATVRTTLGDDPRLAFDRPHHLNLIAYGVEPTERWSGFPAWTEPEGCWSTSRGSSRRPSGPDPRRRRANRRIDPRAPAGRAEVTSAPEE